VRKEGLQGRLLLMEIDNFDKFQQWVWDSLPMRKHACGKERVFDVVAVVVQEWPDEALANCRSGDTAEVIAVKDLVASTKRHLALAYGEREFGFIWMFILNLMVGQIIQLIISWWRRSSQNPSKLRVWKRKWNNG